MDISMAPPQLFGSMIHLQYSSGSFDKAASLYVLGSDMTTEAMSWRRSPLIVKEPSIRYATALNKHELSAAITLQTYICKSRLKVNSRT